MCVWRRFEEQQGGLPFLQGSVRMSSQRNVPNTAVKVLLPHVLSHSGGTEFSLNKFIMMLEPHFVFFIITLIDVISEIERER